MLLSDAFTFSVAETDLLGVVKVPLEEVVLRPSLLPHAVDR